MNNDNYDDEKATESDLRKILNVKLTFEYLFSLVHKTFGSDQIMTDIDFVEIRPDGTGQWYVLRLYEVKDVVCENNSLRAPAGKAYQNSTFMNMVKEMNAGRKQLRPHLPEATYTYIAYYVPRYDILKRSDFCYFVIDDFSAFVEKHGASVGSEINKQINTAWVMKREPVERKFKRDAVVAYTDDQYRKKYHNQVIEDENLQFFAPLKKAILGRYKILISQANKNYRNILNDVLGWLGKN